MDGRRITIDGRHWRLRYVPMRKWGGHCDPPGTKGKEIRIARGALNDTPDRVRLLVHEIVHASRWELDEDAVKQLSADVARILEQEGCLKTDQ